MFEKNASPQFKRHAFGIIVIGCLALYFSCCLSTDALNILQPVFTELGWSYSQLSLPFTIMGYILVAGSFLLSTFIIKNGTRLFSVFAFGSMAVGTLLIAAAYVTNSYPIFFVGGLLSKVGCIASQMFIYQLIAEWFNTTRGRILGIITMAAPLNSATSTAILTFGTNTLGFFGTYLVFGFVMTASTVLAFFFSQTRPSELGMTVDGIQAAAGAAAPEEKPSRAGLTMKQILTQPSTWKLIIAFGIFNGSIGAIMAFHVTRMLSVGVDQTLAVALLSGASLLGILLAYVYGMMNDKFGTRVCCVIMGVLYVVMCAALYFATADTIVLIFIAAFGMSSMTAGCPQLHPASIMYAFGSEEYQNANRYIGIGISLISTFGVQLMSTCTDLGSLSLGYLVFGVLTAIATLCIATTKKVDTEKLLAAGKNS